jgi:hypothetical protein
MSDVDLLREVAALIRERAKDASPSPWSTDADGLVWSMRAGDPVSGSTEVEDARHIAAFADPAVAYAVADWLDLGANPYWCGEREPMYAVARAYLGGAA